jgi:uncharacterized protein
MLYKLKLTALSLVGIVALLTVWGFIEPRLLNVVNETAVIPNLPTDWQGKLIGQVSDFQIGMWAGNPGTARRSIEQLIEAQPAAVLISGDFVYHALPDSEAEITTAVSIVSPLVAAGIPTYGVLGNHDYALSSKTGSSETALASRLATALEAAGVVVLENEAVELRLPNSDELLYVVGVDSHWANRDDVSEALEGVPQSSPRVVLMHNPDTYEQFPSNTAPFAVAGHTHGGQIRLPNLPQWSWLRFTQDDKVYADGWASGYGKPGNNLYINVGIGMSIVPVRIFCPPELTLFRLQSSVMR